MNRADAIRMVVAPVIAGAILKPRTVNANYDLFWAKIQKGEHWIWTGGLAKGFPVWREGNRVRSARQIAWELTIGKGLDRVLELRNTCGQPLCLRPDHQKQARTRNLCKQML